MSKEEIENAIECIDSVCEDNFNIRCFYKCEIDGRVCFVKTAKEALEKQIPKKVGHRHLRKTEYGSHYYCGNCEADLVKVEFFSFDGGEPENKVSYCWHCGNAVDWSENDD